jgi:hypothetical protein
MAAAGTMVAAAEQHEQFKAAIVKSHKELVVPAQKQGLDFNSSAESLRDELKQVSGFDDKGMVLPLAALACVLDDIDPACLQVFPVGNLNDTAPGEMLHAMTADGPAFIFNEDMDIALSAIGWLRNQEAVQAVADGEHNSQTFLFHIHRNSNVHYTREDGEIVNAWDQFKTTVVYVACNRELNAGSWGYIAGDVEDQDTLAGGMRSALGYREYYDALDEIYDTCKQFWVVVFFKQAKKIVLMSPKAGAAGAKIVKDHLDSGTGKYDLIDAMYETGALGPIVD